MRLIDADRIKQSVMNEMLKAELSSPVYYTLECVIADIDNQPTAYDVDKVVEKIKEKGKDDSCGGAGAIWSEDAVEIVKSGGIE